FARLSPLTPRRHFAWSGIQEESWLPHGFVYQYESMKRSMWLKLEPATMQGRSDSGPVQIPKGKVISKRWRILRKLGEGGCGAVYKVEDLQTKK
ncbi:hypothetical protein OSTOST_24283, partial [Ostertagia ostertagi]